MDRRTGVLDARGSRSGDGRLRQLDQTFLERATDPLVPQRLIEQYRLRTGMTLSVEVGTGRPRNGRKRRRGGRPPKGKRNLPRADRVLQIEGTEADEYRPAAPLDEQTTIDPEPRLTLEHSGAPAACRLVDLMCPVGYGQRGLIVSPPKAGKTILLQQIATAVQHNHPECVVFALLVDERPEEVTDFRRNVPCEVLASNNDHPPQRHVDLSMMAIERCKRLAADGKDVVVLLDSLTRLGRAFNTSPSMTASGRVLSGGVDSQALAIPKRLFGAARNTEEGGSLTILATCLVDTGSRGDQVIFEEFKGTGNMELILDREVANHRVHPAINLAASGTRKEHLLLDPQTLHTAGALRRRLSNMKPLDQAQQLLRALERFSTNDELVGNVAPAGS